MPRFPPAVMLGEKNVKPTRTTIAAHSPCTFIEAGTAESDHSLSSTTVFFITRSFAIKRRSVSFIFELRNRLRKPSVIIQRNALFTKRALIFFFFVYYGEIA